MMLILPNLQSPVVTFVTLLFLLIAVNLILTVLNWRSRRLLQRKGAEVDARLAEVNQLMADLNHWDGVFRGMGHKKGEDP